MDGDSSSLKGKERRRYPRVKPRVSGELCNAAGATRLCVSIVEISLGACLELVDPLFGSNIDTHPLTHDI
jgi:hypothetical protein